MAFSDRIGMSDDPGLLQLWETRHDEVVLSFLSR